MQIFNCSVQDACNADCREQQPAGTKKTKSLWLLGFEPRSPRPQRGILTTKLQPLCCAVGSCKLTRCLNNSQFLNKPRIWCTSTKAVFSSVGCKRKNFLRFESFQFEALNEVYLQFFLHRWVVNRETNLMMLTNS